MPTQNSLDRGTRFYGWTAQQGKVPPPDRTLDQRRKYAPSELPENEEFKDLVPANQRLESDKDSRRRVDGREPLTDADREAIRKQVKKSHKEAEKQQEQRIRAVEGGGQNQQASQSQPQPQSQPEEPPARNASTEEWREFLAYHNIEVSEEASRDDLIEVAEQRGLEA